MLSKLSKEQLVQLALYTTGINTILLESLLTPSSPEAEDEKNDVELEIHIVEIGCAPESGQFAQEEKAEIAFMDNLCGEWKGGWRKPYLAIVKTETDYVAVWGKPDSKTGVREQNPIEWRDDSLVFSTGRGLMFLSYDPDNDELVLFPGGTYTRVVAQEKK